MSKPTRIDQSDSLRDIASQLEEYAAELREIALMLRRRHGPTARLATAMTKPLRRDGVLFVQRLEENFNEINVLTGYYAENLDNHAKGCFSKQGLLPRC